MSEFSIFVIEKKSIEEVKSNFRGRELKLWSNEEKSIEKIKTNFQDRELWSNTFVTLESLDISTKANVPFKQIQVSNQTTLLDVIKQYKENITDFNPFVIKEYIDSTIEYGYVLERTQNSQSSVDNDIHSKINLEKYYQTKVTDLGFLDGEVVVLNNIEVSRKYKYNYNNVNYCLALVPRVVDFLSMVRESPSTNEDGLHIVLLYTDADKEFSCFVRESYSDIHVLSGSRFKVYAIENLNNSKNLKESLKYWKSLLSQKLYIVWSSLGWLSLKPYDKTEIYKIANHLGITEENIPCIAVFDILEYDRVFVFPISKTDINIKFFRTLFSNLNKIIDKVNERVENLRTKSLLSSQNTDRKNDDNKILAILQEEYVKLRERLSQISLIETNPNANYYIFNCEGQKVIVTMNDSSHKTQNITAGGDIIASEQAFNLGEISGQVTGTINELPTSPEPEKPGIKELLTQLQAAIEAEENLTPKDKEKALKQVKALAEASQNPNNEEKQNLADTAITMLKGVILALPQTTGLFEAWNNLSPIISKFLGIG
ncbi:hypothetical protein [Nostoc favosum]|uniref:Uncharacterized protein n=1 Tax=Nostoc favosum CHAB5714 TaxID=2780399 RepID=A0ABS8IE33_9NOSO|nr:hypothetical protein [Nostoc favosum]MCC5602453.1 hypothetical protein [Nostoc favosum CHAB5714]